MKYTRVACYFCTSKRSNRPAIKPSETLSIDGQEGRIERPSSTPVLSFLAMVVMLMGAVASVVTEMVMMTTTMPCSPRPPHQDVILHQRIPRSDASFHGLFSPLLNRGLSLVAANRAGQPEACKNESCRAPLCPLFARTKEFSAAYNRWQQLCEGGVHCKYS